MSNLVDKIFAEVCLDERVTGGIFKLEEEEHMNALRDYFTKRGITKEDATHVTNRMVEGRFPERQAYNADGILVTFPTPQHKKEAIKRGTHFEKNPHPENSTPKEAPKNDIPPAEKSPDAPPEEKADEPEKEPNGAPMDKPASGGVGGGPATQVTQGDKTLAVEPPHGMEKPEPPPQAPTPPPVPRTPERVAAEKEVIKQILATDDTVLSPVVPNNESFKHQINELCKKCREWGFNDAEQFLSSLDRLM